MKRDETGWGGVDCDQMNMRVSCHVMELKWVWWNAVYGWEDYADSKGGGRERTGVGRE